MKRNLSQLLQTPPEGGHSKEAFDLHNYEIFHSKGAQLNVVACRDTVPNADYLMSVDAVTRSILCNTANFANIKENWYLVFVPHALVCNNAYQMFVQRRQDYSAITSDIDQFPVFNLADVVSRCIYQAVFAIQGVDADWFDVHGFNIAAGALRLLDMLGYGCYIDLYEYVAAGADTTEKTNRFNCVQDLIIDRLTGIFPSVARIGAYQCVWYNFFRNSIYDVAGDASCYNFDDVVQHVNGQTPTYDVTSFRGVDSFIQKCLKLHYVQNKKDMFMGSMPGTQFGACSTVPLMSNLSFVVNAVTGNDSGRWNTNSGAISRFLGMEAGSKSVVQGISISDTFTPADVAYHTHALSGTVTAPSGTSLFDVLTLVNSQAMQKWRQKSMLAGNKTVDQFRAHHGVVPRHLVDHLPDFIGSVDNEIHVSEITSTANTLDSDQGENNLGDIRGRGYGVSDRKEFNFHSTDYGTILLLHSIVVENTYSSFGLDYGNRLIYYSDFFQQEFQNIGLEAVPKFLADTLSQNSFGPINIAHPDASQSQFLQSQMANLFGMYAKYYGYKEYVDRVHGLFNPTRITNLIGGTPHDRFGYADMQSFVIPREDMTAELVMNLSEGTASAGVINFNLSRIYQNPRLFDSIFAVAADDHFDTDQFFHKVRFNCQALQPMTKLGLPDF